MGKNTEASKAMLASHQAHVLSLLRNKQVAAFVAVLRKILKDARDDSDERDDSDDDEEDAASEVDLD